MLYFANKASGTLSTVYFYLQRRSRVRARSERKLVTPVGSINQPQSYSCRGTPRGAASRKLLPPSYKRHRSFGYVHAIRCAFRYLRSVTIITIYEQVGELAFPLAFLRRFCPPPPISTRPSSSFPSPPLPSAARVTRVARATRALWNFYVPQRIILGRKKGRNIGSEFRMAICTCLDGRRVGVAESAG